MKITSLKFNTRIAKSSSRPSVEVGDPIPPSEDAEGEDPTPGAVSPGVNGYHASNIADPKAASHLDETPDPRPEFSPPRTRPSPPLHLPPREEQGWKRTFASLRNRDFLYFWLGMIVMMGGMQMQMLARGYLVYDITGSASRLGIVAAASAFPMLALALFGGAIADRVERKKLIQIGQFIVGALALLVGILIATGRIEWYYLLTVAVIQGAVWALTMPARQALIPQIVGPEKITNAMALNSAGMSAMTLLAPAVAGGLYALAGPEYVYFVIATMSLVAMGLTTRIETPEQSGNAKKRPLLNEIGEGLTYIRGNSLVLVLLVVGLATTLMHAPFMSLLPVFVVDVYHRGPDSMGLLVAIMGAGALVGSLAVAAMGAWRRGILLLVGAFSTGIALALVAAIPFYAAAAAIMLLMGLGDAGRRTINMGLMMEVSDDRYRGRVMSVFMMNFGLMPLSVLPAGLAADVFGERTVMAVLGIGLIAIAAWILVTQKRLRELD